MKRPPRPMPTRVDVSRHDGHFAMIDCVWTVSIPLNTVRRWPICRVCGTCGRFTKRPYTDPSLHGLAAWYCNPPSAPSPLCISHHRRHRYDASSPSDSTTVSGSNGVTRSNFLNPSAYGASIFLPVSARHFRIQPGTSSGRSS